jgi:Flp pilus assembly pilin Flp
MSMLGGPARELLARARRDEAGQGLTEYASILPCAVLLAVAVPALLGSHMPPLLEPFANAL